MHPHAQLFIKLLGVQTQYLMHAQLSLRAVFPVFFHFSVINVAALYSLSGFEDSEVADLENIMCCCHILSSSATISPILRFYRLHWTNWLGAQIWPSICFFFFMNKVLLNLMLILSHIVSGCFCAVTEGFTSYWTLQLCDPQRLKLTRKTT